jgi:putative membrane protein
MMKRILVTIAMIAVGLSIAFGYSAVNAQSTQTPSTSAPAQQNSQLSEIDRAFVLDAGQAAIGNTMLSQLALERGNSDEVRQFAQAEIDEQNLVRNNLTKLAPRLGISVPNSPAPRHQAAMARLSQLSGESFDQAFLDEGGINAHLENAAVYQREAAFGQNPDLVRVAEQGLPIIDRHFQTASSLTDYQFAQVPRRYETARNR